MSTRRSYKRRSGSVRRWRPRHACAGCEHTYERNTMRSADVLSLIIHRQWHLLNGKTRVEGCIHNVMDSAPHATHKHHARRSTGNANTGTNNDVNGLYHDRQAITRPAATPNASMRSAALRPLPACPSVACERTTVCCLLHVLHCLLHVLWRPLYVLWRALCALMRASTSFYHDGDH